MWCDAQESITHFGGAAAAATVAARAQAVSQKGSQSPVLARAAVAVAFFTFHHSFISNDPSFRQKHRRVPDGSDGSDGTSYPLRENYTLPVAQAMCHVAHVLPLLFGGIYAPSERHVCYTLRSGCSYAEAVFSPAAASL